LDGYARRVVRALLFDFDGLLLDTESPALESWQSIYAEYGAKLPVAVWVQGVIGRATGTAAFDPVAHLEEVTGRTLDRAMVRRRRARREQELLPTSLAPGVERYLAGAAARDLRTAIVTSEYRDRVLAHLRRLAVTHAWDAIVCADGDATRSKPRPTLYLEALDLLGVDRREAIAFEDSPNGVRAAKAAGLFCVAVPNAVTRGADGLEAADLLVASLADLSPEELLAAVHARAPRSSART
jgi:HAD superfamily hydrolase (TIGR01509 family)